MGPIGFQEMILIALVILLLFGAKKLPELARGIGKSMGEFKKAKEDFEDEIKRGTDEGSTDLAEKRGKDERRDLPPRESAPSETVAHSDDSNDEGDVVDGDDEGDKSEAKKEEAETAA